MRLGAPVWPFQWHPPYEEAVRRIASLGFRSVELIAWSPQALEEYVETVRRIMAIVEDARLRHPMEPHPYRYVAGGAGMLRLIDHVPSPALGINYDPSHTFPCGDMPHLAIYQLGARVFHCHF